MPARMLYVYTLSPLHCGTGQAADIIDLPVARERVTNWPIIPGSSLKGPLKAQLRPENGDGSVWQSAFGPDTNRADDGAGGLSFGDARLLCFPARSYAGSFAWLTCPLALRRWQRDHVAGEIALDVELSTLAAPATAGILVTATSQLRVGASEKVVLEDLDLDAVTSNAASAIAETLAHVIFAAPEWRVAFQAQFAIVSDDVFTFLTETATEVVARVQLDATQKTTVRGALWYEEAVPAEAIFACPVLSAGRSRYSAAEHLGLLPARHTLQIGGHGSVGRGLVEITVAGGAI